ncbi:MAG TPA: DUF4838 domain-containing protein [Armatimonadetes bacterium]|nr:DUF4838 domain-containing protein [Armatimonadota bacterium]
MSNNWDERLMLRPLFLLGLMFLVPSKGTAQEAFLVSREGKAQCAIVVAQKAQDRRLTAAQELQGWLKEVTGATLPVETMPPVRDGILLGTAEDFPPQAQRERLQELGPEGFTVRSERNRLWLLANGEMGLQHAVYAFLESIGCRWFFPDPVWTVVPPQPTLVVRLHLREKPAFAYRRIWYGWGPRTPKLREDYKAWLKHNRQLGHFQIHCGHSYEWHLPRKLFEQHPEWFALVEGKRQPRQLCTTNPEVQQRVSEHTLEVFRREPQRNMVSVEPNDGRGYCECENCRAVGSISNRVFLLANVAAKAVRREFPDKWVGLYAYAYHSDPPGFKLEPGVYVQVTTGFRYTKLTFEEQVSAFRRRGAQVGVYDYFSVYPWDWDMPGAAKAGRAYQLAEAIRHYHDLGLTTYDAESSCNWGPNGLGYWVGAKLMWNPNQDPKALVRDFCQRAFGQAAEPMQRLYERWARGERFSPRGLKLALLDLQEAYRREEDPRVRARLDRVAMYLHWLRLWLDYDRRARWNQWGKLVVAPPKEILRRAREVIVCSRRLMDTGLIHAYPMLFTNWFAHRFAALKKVEGFDLKQADPWKKERTDIPTAEEVGQFFAEDLRSFKDLVAVEIEGREFGGPLVPLVERLPEAVQAWGEVPRSPLFVESGTHYFLGKGNETLRLTYTPYPNPPHTVQGHWVLRKADDGNLVAEGDVEAERGQTATVEFRLPADGIFAFEPGTGYWKAAQIGFDVRPLVVWAGRAQVPGKPKRTPLRLWLPRLNQPLYFFVPKGTKHFVIGIASGGDPFTTLVLRTADGTVVLKEKVVAGDQISVIVEEDKAQYGEMSEMAKHTVLPSHQSSVIVPKGKDGQIWSLALSSLRCVVELYDVPPYLARHPSELLVPEGI